MARRQNAAVPKLYNSRTSFVEENVSEGRGVGGWFQDDSSVLCLLRTLSQLRLHQLHLGSSGIRSQRLAIPALYHLPASSYFSLIFSLRASLVVAQW